MISKILFYNLLFMTMRPSWDTKHVIDAKIVTNYKENFV